jgi:hypothetical protein
MQKIKPPLPTPFFTMIHGIDGSKLWRATKERVGDEMRMQWTSMQSILQGPAAAAVDYSHGEGSTIEQRSWQMKKGRHCSKNSNALTVEHKATCPSNAQRKSKWCPLPWQYELQKHRESQHLRTKDHLLNQGKREEVRGIPLKWYAQWTMKNAPSC